MRIISGKARGLKLKSPTGNNIRPTTDRVKESIFNIISPYILESFVLDLFCGSGALGLECISRGAENCVFVDIAKSSITTTKENIKLSKFEKESIVLMDDVISAINKLAIKNDKFDLIFIDPPYLKNLIIPTLTEISRRNILEDDGLIIVEHDINDIIGDRVGKLAKYREKKYGKTMVSFFEWEEMHE